VNSNDDAFIINPAIKPTNNSATDYYQSSTAQPKGRRTKERKIGEIVKKVYEWRRYYNGIDDGKGGVKKLTLDQAAALINISKKSLDDYLLQIR